MIIYIIIFVQKSNQIRNFQVNAPLEINWKKAKERKGWIKIDYKKSNEPIEDRREHAIRTWDKRHPSW